ncbi:MAG: DedA family protein [Melioribacteraceae bacterium]|nr:DedA family protein [Melioribacteraceae bacterium]
MLEEIILYISSVDVVWLYCILFFFAFIENIFPPSPSDVVVVAGASLIASTSLGFIPVLFITSIGSSLGFMLMYYLGMYLSEHVLRSGKLKFISQNSIDKTDKWFTKYGYKLIIANRFMPGTRSVISFFSGVSELDKIKTFVYATISAFVWNILLVYLGMSVGNNIELIDYYLSTYSNIALIITGIILAIWLIRFFIIKNRKSGK